MIDTYIKDDGIFVELEEFLKIFRNCIYNKRDHKRIINVIQGKYGNLKSSKVNKRDLIDYCLDSDEIQEIFYKSFHNNDEIDSLYEEEISNLYNNNMKKMK